jgi:Zn ribbon nucleic-acid-binding protein
MTETLDTRDFETLEQQQEALAEWRLSRALKDAAELFIHARALTLSRTEAGETLTELNAPMKITTEDDVSERYARVAEWVDYFAAELNIAPPVPRIAARRVNGEVHGFRAHVTPEGAGLLVSLLTMWLLIHQEQMQADAAYTVYRDDVTEFMWELRRKYPVDRGREKPIVPRPCPECGEPAIRAEWWSENVNDVQVTCMLCGYEMPSAEFAKIVRRVLS